MKSILLITEGFPFGHREQSFIHSEYDALARRFRVFILAKDYGETEIQKGYEKIAAEKYSDDNKMKRPDVLRKVFSRKEFKAEILCAMQAQKTIREKLGAAHWVLYYANLVFSHMETLREMIRENRIDLVYTYWCKPAAVSAVLLKQEFPGLKVVSRFHGADLYNERERLCWQPFRSLLARELDGLFFVSEYGKRYFAEHWGRDGEVWYLGSAFREELPGGGDRFVLISCSNLIPLKRVELIIRGLAEVDSGCVIQWVHFGDGELREGTEELARELLPSDGNVRFEFRGFLDHEEMMTAYRELNPSLFITASSTEGVPISIVEAMSLGIPCIGTRVGGIPETIEDGVNGTLLSENPTPQEIAGAIQHFYCLTFEEKTRMKQAARKTWESKFNAENNSKRFTEHLQQMMLSE